MKKVRLDLILIRDGFVTEDQITQALMRQRSRGGRLGTHLLYYKFLTEEQLISALAEQFGVSGVRLGGQTIAAEVINKVPVELAEEHMLFPFEFELATRTLSLAIADPDNTAAIVAVKRAARVSSLKAHVAPEIIIRNLIVSHYHGRSRDLSMDQIISLPDLFEETFPKAEQTATTPESLPDPPQTRRVLMVTGNAFLKNFLPPIFEREGFHLTILSDPKQVAGVLSESPFERIVISEDVEEDFYRLVAGGATGSPLPGISVFGTVAGSLMDNPVPYRKVFASLLRSVQLLAQYRTSTSSWKPPYALISKDIQQTGRLLGLRDAAVDGLRVAAHLLVPSEKALQETPGNTGTSLPVNAGSFRNIDRSIQLAESLDFPWDIPGCLRGFMGLITGTDPLSLHRDRDDDTSLATQILALVWYRYYAFENMQGGPQASPETIKLGLRQQAGHLASSPVVESYVSILEQAIGQQGIGLRRNIFIVGNVPDLSPNLVHELKRHGFRTVEVANLEETEHLCNRQAPDAVLVNHDSFPEQTLKFGWSAMKDRQGAGTALFALTESSEPSLIMNLMESGFSDVFAPPFNAAVLVARISKTLAIVTRKGESASGRQGFSATFNELSFTDLIQALAGGGKSVRILLERPTGEKADIYMRTGQIVHAVCGKVSGIEAVYEVISWHNDGSFRVVPATRFPPDTISTSNDYILLEGCRRLDEAGG